MGLFSSKKKTYVSTVTYPLGPDDYDKRNNHTTNIVVNSVLQNLPIAEQIVTGVRNSGGMKLRNAYRYARDKYKNGLPYAHIGYATSVDQSVVIAAIKETGVEGEVYLNTASLMQADFTFWAERYLTATYDYDRLTQTFRAPPDGVEPGALVSYDIDSDGKINIVCINEDNSTVTLSFRPTDFVWQAMYLHTVYQIVQFLPTEISTVVRDFEEGDVNDVDTTNVQTEVGNEIRYEVTKVTTTVVDTTTTIVTEKTITQMSRPKYFLYKTGSGNAAIDSLVQPDVVASPYFPSIPLRIDNVDWTNGAHKNTELYETSEKFLKKMGVDIAELGDKLRTNNDIDQIDYVFIQPGIALNTKHPYCKRYIYEFFEFIRANSGVSKNTFNTWETSHSSALAAMIALAGNPEEAGTHAPEESSGGDGWTNVGSMSPPTNRLAIYDPTPGQRTHALDVVFQWQWADTTVHAGTVWANAKVGDVEVGVTGGTAQQNLSSDVVLDTSIVWARRQLDEDSYEEIRICGFVMTNNVYKDKSVIITAHDAMTKQDEEGFILPLSQLILDNMPILHATELFQDSLHMVMNCYQIVKKKWYQTGLFKIIMFIVAIVISVVTWGAGTGVSMGIMSATAATTIATTLAVSFLVAQIILATLYMLAMTLIMNLLTPVLVDVFGEKWGRVLAVVVQMVAMNYASAGTALGGLSSAPINAATILQGTSAVSQLATAYYQGAMIELDPMAKMEEMSTEYSRRMDEIEKLSDEMLNTRTGIIDIQGFIDSSSLLMEPPNSFLVRTLITGSDICDITRGQIEDFATATLQLPLTG